jgi:hypothetical protein
MFAFPRSLVYGIPVFYRKKFTSVIGWIPFVGMTMHILSAIFILRDAARKDKNPDIIEMS